MFKTVSSKITVLCLAALIPAIIALAGAAWIGSQYKSSNTVFRWQTDKAILLAKFEEEFAHLIVFVKDDAVLGAESRTSEFDDAITSAQNLSQQVTDSIEETLESVDTSVLSGVIGEIQAGYRAILEKKNALTAQNANFQDPLLSDVRKAVADLTVIAFNDGSQELIANVNTIEKGLLEVELDIVQFQTGPTIEGAEEGEAAIKSLRDMAKRARSTFRSSGKDEAKAVFNAVRTLEKGWGDLVETSLDYTNLVDSETHQRTQEISARLSQFMDQMNSAANERSNAIQSRTDQIVSVGLVALVAVLVAVAVFVMFFVRVLARSLANLVRVMGQVASNDMSVEIKGQNRSDELGDMARALTVFQKNASEKHRLEAKQKAMQAQAEEEKRTAINALADSLERDVERIVSTVTNSSDELVSLAQAMKSTAEDARQQSMHATDATGTATSKVEASASVSRGMKGSINDVMRKIDQSAEKAHKASESVSTTAEMVAQLEESAGAISSVVALINNVAEKTNLLALNATIEAARVGEAGKGFAVVASEVKSLASQTAKATDQVETHIAEIQGRTANVVSAIQNIGTVIEEMLENASGVSQAMEQQTTSSGEIAESAEFALQGMTEVSSNLASAVNSVDKTDHSASRVLEASSELSNTAESLSVSMDQFLGNLRSA